MAAAGMASAMGATPAQALHAAELALEPHLGLACDPVGGRVESPCIERNGLAAARACAAASAAIRVPEPRVALDAVVRSMVETARGLAGRYKQASLGGVALSVPDC
jgi:L-serine dehydratase